jgi:hypothetical protein
MYKSTIKSESFAHIYNMNFFFRSKQFFASAPATTTFASLHVKTFYFAAAAATLLFGWLCCVLASESWVCQAKGQNEKLTNLFLSHMQISSVLCSVAFFTRSPHFLGFVSSLGNFLINN